MKWPFVRHAHAVEASAAGAAPGSAAEPRPPAAPGSGTAVDVSARRDWSTLPPMNVAGGRPITLTAAPRTFIDGLASRQVLMHSSRLEQVRRIDAPSGSLRGVLTPEAHDHDRGRESGPTPELKEPSPLPVIEHRRVAALSADHSDGRGLSPMKHVHAIGDDLAGRVASGPGAAEATYPTGADDAQPDGGSAGPGRRAGLADSRRRGLGPAYHGPLPEAMRTERERADDWERERDGGPGLDRGPGGAMGVSVEAVPGDVRAAVLDVLGVDVGDRLVHRGPGVSAEARAIGAQAFTRDGQVYVGDDVGPLNQAAGRAALAHELTHAAQQIVHGTLPDEGSTAGRTLEAHAQQVEQYVRGDGGAIKPTPELLHARPPTNVDPAAPGLVSTTRQMMRELVDTGLARSDGNGGIVFTMPPSAMTAATGTQRQTTTAPAAQQGAAARQENWDVLDTLGNTLTQGLANDMLGIAGSVFGFSDELMDDERRELADANRMFGREQTKRAYTELRMEHLRTAELTWRNAEESAENLDRTMSLDEEVLRQIETRVDDDVNQRMRLLEGQIGTALDRINEKRAARSEPALEVVPDESYDGAFHLLFDHPETDELPTDEQLLTVLEREPSTTTGTGPSRAARRAGGPPSQRARRPESAATGAARGSAAESTRSATEATALGAGPGAASEEEKQKKNELWRTNATMGGRFEALGNALLGDVAHAEVGFFGSLLGFDDRFEEGLHEDITPSQSALTADAARSTLTADAARSTPTADAARSTPTADAARSTPTADAARSTPAAHETVEHIVGDPYALDELATRLYPNIRSRLRQELLIDRERAGLLADFR